MKKRIRISQTIFLGGCIVLMLASCTSSKSFKALKLPASISDEINTLCEEQSALGRFPGLAVAIVDKDSRIWSKSYGYADIESKVPIDPDTHLFRIGSISKAVTAAALARLCEDDELDLDLPIANYYSTLPVDKALLTLRILGGHLGGIRHYNGDEFLSKEHYDNVFEPLKVFIADPLLCVPGSDFKYSTYGWTLMSAVIESGAGDNFLDIIEKEVSTPLKLSDLKADQIDSTQYPRVSFYHLEDDQHQIAPVVDLSNKWAGGGYLCSLEDLAKFGHALTGPGYLEENSLEIFTTSQTTSSGLKTNYGIGFRTGTDDQGRKWIGHGGGSVGGTSMLLIYPEEDLVVVTLVNMGAASMSGLAHKISDVILNRDK